MSNNTMSSSLLGGGGGGSTTSDNRKPKAVVPRRRLRSSSSTSSSLGFLLLLFIIYPLLTTTTTTTAAATSPTTGVAIDAISINDVATGIEDIVVIHNNRAFAVLAELIWEQDEEEPTDIIIMNNTTRKMIWKMLVDDVIQDSGEVTLESLLAENKNVLPTTLEAGTTSITQSGTHSIMVEIQLVIVEEGSDDTDAATTTTSSSSSNSSRDYQSFAPGASFAPLAMVVGLAAITNMVELSLALGIFTGSCMVAGTFTAGFRDMFSIYILEALANVDHGFVYLFILFMAGLVGLIEKAGGLAGVTLALRKYVKTPFTAQLTTLFAGLIIFFDDYSNTLVAGSSMRPLTDACVVSREKLAFIVDATSAPIASLTPISSWIGFEIGLIQTELDVIKEMYPESTFADTSSFTVFVRTIQYRYYCIFMLIWIPLVIFTGRDFGPMIVAERLTKVYGRTDGGPGKAKGTGGRELASHCSPNPETLCRWWNMAIPIAALVIYIFCLLIWTGKTNPDATGEETMSEIFAMADAYTALMWGTMAGALTAVLLYFLQDHKDGKIIWFNARGYRNKIHRFIRRKFHGEVEEEGVVHAKVLMNTSEAMSAFLLGMEKIFGALVVLTLAWATGAIMTAVGLNRFFSEILTNPALDVRLLPTLTFSISILIAFATGSSWGTMAIMFPLTVVPTYTASLGYDDQDSIMYGVIASILAGSVAGDHASPISDTTILSAMASGCDVLQHVKTQGPYAVMVALWSILAGTLPNGRGVPNWACIIIGFAAMMFHSAFTSAFVINKTGRFDIMTELFIRFKKDKSFYDSLRADTVKCFETGQPVPLPDGMAQLLLNSTRNDDNGEGDTTIRTKNVDDDDEAQTKKLVPVTEHTNSSFDILEEKEQDIMTASKNSKSSLIDSGAIFASFMKHITEDHGPADRAD